MRNQKHNQARRGFKLTKAKHAPQAIQVFPCVTGTEYGRAVTGGVITDTTTGPGLLVTTPSGGVFLPAFEVETLIEKARAADSIEKDVDI